MALSPLKHVLDWIFPSFCLACRKEAAWACAECLLTITPRTYQSCPACNQPSPWGFVCPTCSPKETDFYLDGLFSPYNYHEQALLALLIHNFKYSFIRELSIPLSALLAKAITPFIHHLKAQNASKNIVFCPVPLHLKRLRWRGFNQSELLANQLAQYFELPLLHLLQRQTFSVPQQSIKRDQRIMNLRGAFSYSPLETLQKNISTVLLVDDVATTLSTLQACAEILKKAGVSKVYGIVLARTEL